MESLLVRELRTGRERWRVSLVDDVCARTDGWVWTSSDTVVAVQFCAWPKDGDAGADSSGQAGTLVRATAFDAVDGDERWWWEETFPGDTVGRPVVLFDGTRWSHRPGQDARWNNTLKDSLHVGHYVRLSGYLVLDGETGRVLADDPVSQEHLVHFTGRSASVPRPLGSRGTAFERRTWDGTAEVSAVLPERAAYAELDWVALDGTAVALRSVERNGEHHHGVGVAPWYADGEVRTVALPDVGADTGADQFRLLPAPGAVLAVTDREVVGLG